MAIAKRFMSSPVRWLLLVVALILSGCAVFPVQDPLRVTVAGIESLPSESMEARMLVKLRVQNPNDVEIAYDGAAVKLDLLDATIASGVTDARGTIPRYGEAVVAIPVTLSMVNVAVQMMKLFHDKTPPATVRYKLEGKLDSPGFGTMRFRLEAQLKLPGYAQ
jgi:LEA14-like dessication related protein